MDLRSLGRERRLQRIEQGLGARAVVSMRQTPQVFAKSPRAQAHLKRHNSKVWKRPFYSLAYSRGHAAQIPLHFGLVLRREATGAALDLGLAEAFFFGGRRTGFGVAAQEE